MSPPARVAVVDDEPRMAAVLGMVLRRDGHAVDTFTEPAAFLAALDETAYDLLVTDLRMPGMDGVALLAEARRRDPELPVVLVTAHATVETAVEAMRQGAVDYLQKPVDNDACRRVVRRSLESTALARQNRYLRAELAPRHQPEAFIATSPAMQRVVQLARRAARSRSTVLVTGESGTGKELVARAIHFHSDRVGGPFEAVNCKAFASGLVESELFGHERGAFTGAMRARPGLFERGHGGTVFLDEIGEVDGDFQARLLRVLQEGEIRRVGADASRGVDVRVVAATNRDLATEVREGRFREDLYFRLAVIPIRLPPLRERPEDVLPLARHFLLGAARAQNPAVTGWTEEVERWLVAHPWPGNVRELENTIERGVVLAEGATVGMEDLLLEAAASPRGTLEERLDRHAAAILRETLAEVGGARAEAADRLGIERTTLYRMMKRLGIE